MIIISASTTDESNRPNSITIDGGSLSINGSENDPVVLNGLYEIYLSRADTHIFNTIFEGTGLNIWQGTTTIFKSKIENAVNGISATGSYLDIKKSRLINNKYGIISYKYSKGPFLMMNQVEDMGVLSGTGGIGNALDTATSSIFDLSQNIINVHGCA